MWQEKTRGYSSGSFALHIPCAVPALMVRSESSNVSKRASNCRRNVVFSTGDSECMYWSTDMWNMVTSWMNSGKLGYWPSFSMDCKCLAEMPSYSANYSLVILCFSRAFWIACPNSRKSKSWLVIFSPPVFNIGYFYCTEMKVLLKRCESSCNKRFDFLL